MGHNLGGCDEEVYFNAFGQCLLHLFLEGRHFCAGAAIKDCHLVGAQTQG